MHELEHPLGRVEHLDHPRPVVVRAFEEAEAGIEGGVVDQDQRRTVRRLGLVDGRLERVDLATGRLERLFDTVDGLGLRGPNDIVFDTHGGFYFTDLGKGREADMDMGAVHYGHADGRAAQVVARPLLTPNGVGLSPDAGATWQLARRVPRALAMRMLCARARVNMKLLRDGLLSKNGDETRRLTDVADEFIEQLWGAITCPTLLLYGADSWASNPEKDGRIAHFKTASVIEFEKAGHWLHHDQFDRFIATLRDFL